MSKKEEKAAKAKKAGKKKDKDDKRGKGKNGRKSARKGGKGKKETLIESAAKPVLAAGKKKVNLADMKCVPCRGDVPPLGEKEIKKLLPKLRGWAAVDGHHLERQIMFPDFASALDFTIEVGELAETEQHHPDIYLAWGRVGIKIWTHKINGLTESDFVLAAKIDQLG